MTRESLIEALNVALPEPLPDDWPDARPLTEAGLDSVAMLTLVAEIEARLGAPLAERDLSEEHFSTLAGLVALVERRGELA